MWLLEHGQTCNRILVRLLTLISYEMRKGAKSKKRKAINMVCLIYSHLCIYMVNKYAYDIFKKQQELSNKILSRNNIILS